MSVDLIKASRNVPVQQRTIARPAGCSGFGVHSGKPVNLAIKPAPANHGIKFVRTDLQDSPKVPALFKSVVDTSLATVIGYEGFIVSTIEHLMAVLSAFMIDNALLEIDAYEMPIMDGSAAPFVEMIKSAGVQMLQAPRCYFRVKEPIELEEDGKSVGIYPCSTFKVTCSVEYPHPLIGRQTLTLEGSSDIFEREIAPARTFGFLKEVEYLKRFGLARGGSLDNAIVVTEDGILNPGGLRYPDEFVRHKILDCIGDFALLGIPILGHIIASKSGHTFHHAFLNKFFSEKKSWETYMVS